MCNIPSFIKSVNGIKLFERVLLSQIHYLSAKRGYCFAKNDYFAEFFEVSLGTVKRALKKLEDMGLIVRVSAGWGRRYIYVSCAPAEEKPAEKAEEKPVEKENVTRISQRGFKYWQKVCQQPAPTKYHRAKDEKKLSEEERIGADVVFEKCFEKWHKKVGGG